MRFRLLHAWRVTTVWLALGAVFTVLLTSAPALAAQTTSTNDQPAHLIDAWLSFPDAVDIQPPYTYLSAVETGENTTEARQDILDEFKRLRWRLKDGGYSTLVNTLDQWRARLNGYETFREPGDWSPAFLLSHPNRQPPIDEVAAIGACDVPTTVGVWSAAGYDQITWHSGLRLSDIEDRVPATRHGARPMIALVDPLGHVDHYGVQAWNYADTQVAPGSQVVASLPLGGEAFAWIRDSMANLLAHVPSGVNCRQQTISGEAVSAQAGS